ncbi:MAG: Zn-dependent hydrolase, partial [Acidobacteriota bacterium]
NEKGEFGPVDIKDFYVTFMTSVFRSIRFGAASAHGRANLARFNFFKEMNALTRDAGTGTYKVHFDRMTLAMNSLSEKILRFQGDGDYEGVAAFMKKYGNIGPDLRTDLDRLSTKGIPVDIVFQQGMSVLKEERSAR